MTNEQLAEIFERRAKSWRDASSINGSSLEIAWWISSALNEIAEEIRALPKDPLQIELEDALKAANHMSNDVTEIGEQRDQALAALWLMIRWANKFLK